MKIVKLTDEITLMKTQGLDKWGLPLSEAEEVVLPAKVSMYFFNDKDEEDLLIPSGSVLLDNLVQISAVDRIKVTLADGNTYQLTPDTIKHIKDLRGRVIYTKVSFSGR